MFEFLDKLRAKPAHIRQRVAFATTAAIFFVIVNIWWQTDKVPDVENPVSVHDVVSPLQVVANVFISTKDAIGTFGDELSVKFSNASTAEAVMADPDSLYTPKKDSASDIVYPEQIFPSMQGLPEDKLRATTTTSN